MDIKLLVGLAIQLSLLLLVLSVGMRSKWSDLLYVFHQPRNLFRGLIAVNVVVPLAALILGTLFPLTWQSRAGLLLMAVSPLAPFATGKMLKNSADRSYDVGLYAALILAAVIIVPLTVALLNSLYVYHKATISVGEIAWFVTKSVLLPLAAGLTIATLWPRFAERAAPIAALITYIVIIPLSLLFLVKFGAQLVGLIGDGTLYAIMGTIAAGLAAGHFLGGRNPGHRGALSMAAATRHPGIALLITEGDLKVPEVTYAVILFLIVSLVMTALYGLWLRRKTEATSAEQQ